MENEPKDERALWVIIWGIIAAIVLGIGFALWSHKAKAADEVFCYTDIINNEPVHWCVDLSEYGL